MPTSASNKDVIQELQDIIKQWEEDQNVATSDPTPHLLKLCELFEREADNFQKKDPDPFDDRHPVTSQPDCALGQILRALFKKDAFINKLVGQYLKDNYFSNLGLLQSSTPVNTAACRLLIDLLQGLDVPQVFQNSDSTVSRLFSWAESAEEPLASYATGLLSAAVDIEDIPTNFRDSNARLVPILLKRLWQLKNEGAKEVSQLPERPFAHLGNENSIKMRNGNIGSEEHQNKKRRSHSPLRSPNESGSFNLFGSPKSIRNENHVKQTLESASAIVAMSPAHHIVSDCSNSSWAEMSSYILGTFQMHPVNTTTKQIFILKYLRPVGEYQESLGHIYEHKALDLIFYFMNVKNTNNARLSFESLRFLGSLLFHKKFCLEFVNIGGVEKLLEVPRPSLPSGGVAVCLWYLAFCEEAVEKICVLPNSILDDLVRYALWLMESSHQSSCQHAVMFFGMVFKFRAILEKFDEQDGLRKMLNKLSTMSIFQSSWDQEIVDEPNDLMMWQTIKQVCLSVKSYFAAHLALKVIQMQRAHTSQNSYPPSLPSFKAMTVTGETVEKNIEYLLEHLPFRAKWKPVEQFIHLKGLAMFLQLVGVIFQEQDLYSLNRTETAEHTLGTLYICSAMPLVQACLCDKVSIPVVDELIPQNREVPGYAILVACIPDTTEMTSPDLQKMALYVLINCVGCPIHRPGSIGNTKPISTPGGSNKRKFTTSEDVIKKCWDSVRTSNGIMYLLTLLHKKTPITDADEVRALACRALVGLSRSETARQIMSKLPIFSSGQLQLLMREPVLQEKRLEHGRFQRSALDLIKAVSGHSKSESTSSCPDITIQSIHRADVVAQTKIQFNKKQLLQLIQSYLSNEGYENVATALQKEGNLPPLPQPNIMGPPLRTPSMSTPSNRSLSISTPTSNNRSTRHPDTLSKQLFSSSTPYTNGMMSTPPNNIRNGNSPSIQIKVNRKTKNLDTSCEMSNSPSYSSPSVKNFFGKKENHLPMSPNPVNLFQAGKPLGLHTIPGTNTLTLSESGISLERIVTEYLTSQHALCKNPVVTCPTFDLFQPHRCPEPKSVRAAPTNFTLRYIKQPYLNPKQSHGYAAMNRKYIYSRYRPSHLFKAADDNEIFLCCDFTPDDQFILVGTTKGDIRMRNKVGNSEEGVYTVHSGPVSSFVTHNSKNLLLTSCNSIHESALWSMEDLFYSKFTIQNCDIAAFSQKEDKILGTHEQVAKLYDLSTSQEISKFTPKLSNHYRLNQAALDPNDELLLTDGVLFDVKSGKQIHKFDKINPILNGVFHKNGLEIISSSEIWDLRTFHLLRTVPALNLCDIIFNHNSDVMFGITVADLDESEENAYDTSFKTVDALTYSSIATIDVRRIVSSLAINPSDTQIAIVETDGSGDDALDSAVVRIYDIGMNRWFSDEVVEEDDDDDVGSDDDDSDNSSDDNFPPNGGDNSNDDDDSSNNSNDSRSSMGGEGGINVFSMDEFDFDNVEPDDQMAVNNLLDLLERQRSRLIDHGSNSSSSEDEDDDEQDDIDLGDDDDDDDDDS